MESAGCESWFMKLSDNASKLILSAALFALAGSILVGFPTASVAASKSDQALALAASGCLAGFLDAPSNSLAFGDANRAELIAQTAIGIQGIDAETPVVQIHHTQMAEGWNSAAFLDSRWKNLNQTYSALFSFAGTQIKSGKAFFEISRSATTKYGGIFASNCKIALTSARAKAKAKSVTLPTWIIRNAGNLLPPLDPRSAKS